MTYIKYVLLRAILTQNIQKHLKVYFRVSSNAIYSKDHLWFC